MTIDKINGLSRDIDTNASGRNIRIGDGTKYEIYQFKARKAISFFSLDQTKKNNGTAPSPSDPSFSCDGVGRSFLSCDGLGRPSPSGDGLEKDSLPLSSP